MEGNNTMYSVKSKKGRLLICLLIIVFIIETYFAFDLMFQNGLNKWYENKPRGTLESRANKTEGEDKQTFSLYCSNRLIYEKI